MKTERIIKVPDQAEAIRFFNYPFRAIEEALVNAVYHRSYEVREPIEVRIHPDQIEIVSHPGADPSIPLSDVKSGHMATRRYRNRRIGEFLKELDLTEGRGTGLPKIQWALKANGSPNATYITDEDRTYFYTVIEIHPEFLKPVKAPVEAPVEAPVKATLNGTELKILQICLDKPVGRKDILFEFGHKTFSGNMKQALKRLKELGLIEPTIENKPSSRNQQYKITKVGRQVLE